MRTTEEKTKNELEENIQRFKLLDNDTIVFLLSIIWQNSVAIQALTMVLKERGETHTRNLLELSPEFSN